MVRFRPRRFVVSGTLVVCALLMLRSILLVGEVKPEEIGHRYDRLQKQLSPSFDIKLVKPGSVSLGNVFKSRVLGNYENLPPSQEGRTGPGEYAKAVKTTPDEQKQVDRSINEYGFNQYVSDKISLDRTIKDLREEQCKYWHYPESLPAVGVIIVFHNEGWSTLLRTVHSLFNRTPPTLLHEVVLVDDFSNKEHLRERLEEYVKEPRFLGKIKLVRNAKREGLIRTRTVGAIHSTADVLVWLDAHCEVGINWLPPLLSPIAQNRTTVTVPIIDVIDNMDYTMRSQGSGELSRGGFDWSLYWKHLPMSKEETRKRSLSSEPYRSPAMAGGLFAMARDYFFELGAYDPGLEVWGGENFELSFKIWQCGGSMLWVPCSHVGHVYRILGKVPYRAPNATMTQWSLRNYRRVVEVWMDDYKEFFYRSKPESQLLHFGDISKQLEFKTKHNCKNFDWFMKEVAPDLLAVYPVPAANQAWGEIKSNTNKVCVDTMGNREGGTIGISGCHGQGGNQLFRITEDHEFRIHELCLYEIYSEVKLRRCDGKSKYSWFFDESKGWISLKDKNLCLELNSNLRRLSMKKCDISNGLQKWIINNQLKIS
ncbi:N-acetylgalactosaminyltransferase 7-like [Saccoglossus kowalevskii]|uniref:Polypeptide N-acetylgalactosaminyltransferase n=1 Tax=Saccoglossus kowalevskii TaxID=10224 RepID=A0A1L7H7F7_SACKO|nr:PREDICTED: N-acetylgalactosaminyltransferase 7-like [Saccoglossus kowalevskii]APU50785.1 N-acetylgalactosaminyltransferase 7-like protein 140 [Saccoglossus kowalevskii]